MALFVMIDFGASPATDTGARPYTGSAKFWNNASIWLSGGPSQTSAHVGDSITVNVRVSNSSSEPIEAVTVDCYVMNPFVGPFDPAHALANMRGFASSIATGSGSTSPTDPHVVDCLVQDLNAGPIPWKPTEAQLETNNGHLCIVANAYADGDGAPIGGTTTFDVQNDPHLGQRNIGLLPKSQMMKIMVMPAADAGPTELMVRRLPSTAIRAGERWLLRSLRDVAKGDGKYSLHLSGRGARLAVPLTFSRKWIRGEIAIDGFETGNLGTMDKVGAKLLAEPRLEPLAAMGRRMRPDVAGQIDGRFVLPERDEPVFADIKVDRADEQGALQAFDIVQRDRAGRVIGGYRVLSLQR